MTVTTSAPRPQKLALKKKLKFIGLGLGAIGFAYFFPKLTLFYAICGIYDVTPSPAGHAGVVLRQYFVGNGVPTWLLSPFNIADGHSDAALHQQGRVPAFRSAGALSRRSRAPDRAVSKSQNLVGELAERIKQIDRTMIFFKWYGENVDTFLDTPAFHEKSKYVQDHRRVGLQ